MLSIGVLFLLATPSDVVVYELEASGFEPRQTRLLEHALIAEVNKREGVHAVGVAEARERSTFEEPAGCAPRDCLAALVNAIGADHVITGRIARLGSTTAITLRLIDLRDSEVVTSSVRQLAKSDGRGVLAALGPMVEELLPEASLADGRVPGVSETLQERWEPAPFGPTPFYVGLGTTVALAGVAAAFGITAQDSKGDFERALADSSEANPANGPEVLALEDDFQSNRDMSNVFWIATAASAVTTTVLFFLTDFDGDESITLTPMADGGVSAGAVLRF